MINPRFFIPSSRSRIFGNAAAEYGIVGSLIIVTSISGFMLLGGDFSTVLGNLNTDMKQKIQVSEDKNNEIKAAKAAAEKARQEALARAAQQAALGGGAYGSPQTLGANGNNMLNQAQTIEQAAKNAFAAGKISQTEYDLLMRMAQMGHDMAFMEGALALARGSAAGNTGAYQNSRVNYNGGSYSPAELSAMMGAKVPEFGALRYQAEQMGLFNNPDVGNIVNSASSDILGSGGASADISKDPGTAVQVGGITNADVIHSDSAAVCGAGGHTDSGTNCSS